MLALVAMTAARAELPDVVQSVLTGYIASNVFAKVAAFGWRRPSCHTRSNDCAYISKGAATVHFGIGATQGDIWRVRVVQRDANTHAIATVFRAGIGLGAG